VPSFGDWGFVMASSLPKKIEKANILSDTKFLDKHNFPSLFVFEKDIQTNNIAINQLDQPVLLNYYLKGWKYYAR
jgi:spermidine synthase